MLPLASNLIDTVIDTVKLPLPYGGEICHGVAD